MKTVIVPTLNEVENIGLLIHAIRTTKGLDQVSIVVIDDNSRDGTQALVSRLAKELGNILLIVRKRERGLGSAVRRGASEVKEGPVVVMDADLSHDPSHLPAMFDKLQEGFDVVVGSRYVPGGKTIGWPGKRIAISKVATLISRLLFRLPVRDLMSGFVGCRSAKVLANGFKYADYKFLLEMLVRNRSLRVAEVPIVFRDRTMGKSKLSGLTIGLFLSLILRMLFLRTPRKCTIDPR